MFIPHTSRDIEKILKKIGYSSIDQLYREATSIEPVDFTKIDLPSACDIIGLMKHLDELAKKNNAAKMKCFCGGGIYNHFVHPATDQIVLRGEFLTAYTPYQPEVSQGTLQSIFEFQTISASLLGTEVANASMYDGASAVAEAVLMARRLTKREKVLIARSLHPHYVETIRTYCSTSSAPVEVIPFDANSGQIDLGRLSEEIDNATSCFVVGYPNFFGVVEEIEKISKIVHEEGSLLITSTQDAVSLGMIEAPGRLGADIAVSEGQGLGIPMAFGGPGLGLLGCRRRVVKQMPGRLVGKTVDADGRTCYVLTLAMREQHIRRERATSNICTNHNLCALMATVHLCLLGREGFKKQAEISACRAYRAYKKLTSIEGIEPVFSAPFFNEFVLRIKPLESEKLIDRLARRSIIVGPPAGRWFPEMDDCLLVACTEMVTDDDIDALCSAMGEVLG